MRLLFEKSEIKEGARIPLPKHILKIGEFIANIRIIEGQGRNVRVVRGPVDILEHRLGETLSCFRKTIRAPSIVGDGGRIPCEDAKSNPV